MARLSLLLTVLLTACHADGDDTAPNGDGGGSDGGGSTDGGAPDGGATDGGGTDGGATDGGSADGGSTKRRGRTGYLGTATATVDGYSGTEEWYFVGDDDADLCRISTTLVSTGARTDCTDCTWAFDLVRSDPTVLVDTGPGCAALTGIEIASLEGQTTAYGYDPEYFGHARVLMVYDSGDWSAGAFAVWDEESGGLTYDREDGYFEYP